MKISADLKKQLFSLNPTNYSQQKNILSLSQLVKRIEYASTSNATLIQLSYPQAQKPMTLYAEI